MLGLTYARMGMEDSLVHYVSRSLEIAYQEGTPEQIQHIARNYAAILSARKGEGEKALKVLREVQRRYPADYDYEDGYGMAYLACGNLDSAECYINKIKDWDTSSSSVRMLYQAVIRAKRDLPINSTLPQLQDSILFANYRTSRTENERAHVQDLMIRKQLVLKAEKANQEKIFMGVLAAAFAVTGLLVFGYQRKLLKKERLIRETSQQVQFYANQLNENETIIHENEDLLQFLSGQLEEQETVRTENERLQEENISLQQKITQYANKPSMDITLFEDNHFIRTYTTYRNFNRMNVEGSFSWKLFKDFVQLSLNGGMNRYISKGYEDIRYRYTDWYYGVNLSLNYKKWMLSGSLYKERNRFSGSESIESGENAHTVQLKYNQGKYAIGLGAMSPFANDFKSEVKNLSKLAPYKKVSYIDDLSQMLYVTFSWNLTFGRKYENSGTWKKIYNADASNSILKADK